MAPPLFSKFTIKSFKENRMFYCSTMRKCQYGPRSAASRLIATVIIAATTLAASGVVSAETSQYYSGAVGGLRAGMEDTGHFGSVSEDKMSVYESIHGSYWGANASATDAGGGTVKVRTSIASPPSETPSYIDSLQALASLRYAFVLDGPATTSKIPVLLTGAGSVFYSHDGYAALLFEFSAYADGVLVDYSIDTLGPLTSPVGVSHSFSVNQIYDLTPGATLTLTLQANSRVRYPGIADGQFAVSGATVDPIFTVLGGYSDSYYFVGLPASAIGPVPEPSSWLMMVAGFGVIGSWTRRRYSCSVRP